MLDIDIALNYDNFSLNFSEQLSGKRITAILGHSGSGKTSLLRVIAGLNHDAYGRVQFNNQAWQSHNQFMAAEKRQIGFVFQDARLFPHLNVQQNLNYALKRRAQTSLGLSDIAQMTQITPLLSRRVDKLSAGEKQRVALARALLSAPQLLLLDEPLSSLDNKSRGAMIALLKTIQQKLSLPMLYVSHSVAEVQQLADDVVVMKNGHVVQRGHVHQVLNQLEPSITSVYSHQTSLSLVIKQHLYHFGLTQLTLQPPLATARGGNTPKPLTLYSNIIELPLGSAARAYIMASDISISLDKANNSSINNILKGRITNIARLGQNLALVHVAVLTTPFAVTISRYSVEKLQLELDKMVYIQFKASAIKTL